MIERKSTQAVGRFFDGYARDFDAIYGHTTRRNVVGRWIDRTFRQVMMHRFEETLQHTKKREIHSVLDVGCGPGRYVAAFALQGKEVVGIDIAEGMLQIARDRLASLDIASNVELISGDYRSASFDQSFDAACLMGFFDYIENPIPVLKKLATEVRSEIYASFPKSGGVLARQRQIRYRLRNCPLWLYDKQDVEDMLIAAGFSGLYEVQDFRRDWYVYVQMKNRG